MPRPGHAGREREGYVAASRVCRSACRTVVDLEVAGPARAWWTGSGGCSATNEARDRSCRLQHPPDIPRTYRPQKRPRDRHRILEARVSDIRKRHQTRQDGQTTGKTNALISINPLYPVSFASFWGFLSIVRVPSMMLLGPLSSSQKRERV